VVHLCKLNVFYYMQIEAEECRLRELMRQNEATLVALANELDQVVLPRLQLRCSRLDACRSAGSLRPSSRFVNTGRVLLNGFRIVF